MAVSPLQMSVCIVFVLLLFPLICSGDARLLNDEKSVIHSRLNNIDQLRNFYQKYHRTDQLKSPENNLCFASLDHLLIGLNLTNQKTFTLDQSERILPEVVASRFNNRCEESPHPSKWKNFFVGLVAVVIINLTSLFGAIILPFRKKSTFKWLLTIFIGLAVGTLLGTGIFHLIPVAFSVENFDLELSFLNKGLLTLLIIYLYSVRDQLGKIFLHVPTIASSHSHGGIDADDHDDDDENGHSLMIEQQNEQRSLKENLREMKAIGWMILVSDLLHGFIDGITMGAISILSISECLKMLVPIASEEFSHKLGDAAVLLSSGLPIKQALLMNFLSSCSVYPGFLLGAKLGELENFHPWICALAGGMFVYIALADMVPELISMGNEIEKDYQKTHRPVTLLLKLQILFCQNVGLVFGVLLMFVLGKYGEDLTEALPFH